MNCIEGSVKYYFIITLFILLFFFVVVDLLAQCNQSTFIVVHLRESEFYIWNVWNFCLCRRSWRDGSRGKSHGGPGEVVLTVLGPLTPN